MKKYLIILLNYKKNFIINFNIYIYINYNKYKFITILNIFNIDNCIFSILKHNIYIYNKAILIIIKNKNIHI